MPTLAYRMPTLAYRMPWHQRSEDVPFFPSEMAHVIVATTSHVPRSASQGWADFGQNKLICVRF